MHGSIDRICHKRRSARVSGQSKTTRNGYILIKWSLVSIENSHSQLAVATSSFRLHSNALVCKLVDPQPKLITAGIICRFDRRLPGQFSKNLWKFEYHEPSRSRDRWSFCGASIHCSLWSAARKRSQFRNSVSTRCVRTRCRTCSWDYMLCTPSANFAVSDFHGIVSVYTNQSLCPPNRVVSVKPLLN